jgi:hypothetical protein
MSRVSRKLAVLKVPVHAAVRRLNGKRVNPHGESRTAPATVIGLLSRVTTGRLSGKGAAMKQVGGDGCRLFTPSVRIPAFDRVITIYNIRRLPI